MQSDVPPSRLPRKWSKYVWDLFIAVIEVSPDRSLAVSVPGVLAPLAYIYSNVSSEKGPPATALRDRVFGKSRYVTKTPESISEYLRRWQLELYKSNGYPVGNFFNRAYRLMMDAEKCSSFGTNTLNKLEANNVELVVVNNTDEKNIRKSELEQQNIWIMQRCRLLEGRYKHLLRFQSEQAKAEQIPFRIFRPYNLSVIGGGKHGILQSLCRFSFTLEPSTILSVNSIISFGSFGKTRCSVPVRAIRLKSSTLSGDFNVIAYDKYWNIIELPIVGRRLRLFVTALIPSATGKDCQQAHWRPSFDRLVKVLKYLSRRNANIKSSTTQMQQLPIKSLMLPYFEFFPRRALNLTSTMKRKLNSVFETNVLGELGEKIQSFQHLTILDASVGEKRAQMTRAEEEEKEDEDQVFHCVIDHPFFAILWDSVYDAPVIFARIGTGEDGRWNSWTSTATPTSTNERDAKTRKHQRKRKNRAMSDLETGSETEPEKQDAEKKTKCLIL